MVKLGNSETHMLHSWGEHEVLLRELSQNWMMGKYTGNPENLETLKHASKISWCPLDFPLSSMEIGCIFIYNIIYTILCICIYIIMYIYIYMYIAYIIHTYVYIYIYIPSTARSVQVSPPSTSRPGARGWALRMHAAHYQRCGCGPWGLTRVLCVLGLDDEGLPSGELT